MRFLANEQDRWTGATVLDDDRDSGAAAFYPTNWSGDYRGLTFDAGHTDSRVAGITATKITYRPTIGRPEEWAAISWVYPDIRGGNWGDVPGRDLTGATKLRGWIKGQGTVVLKIGGINIDQYGRKRDRAKPFADTFTGTQRERLTRNWKYFEIPIPRRARRDNVIGGFTLAFEDGAADVFLDEISYDRSEPNALRVIRSYTPTADQEDDRIRNVGFLYDNALCLIALLSLSDGESRERARQLANTLCWAQLNDRAYADGRWRNGYAVSPIKDPATGKARLPGIWNAKLRLFDEDRYCVSSDVGNVCWASIALLTAHEVLAKGERDSPYLRAAIAGAEWVERNCRVEDKYGGYSGGFEGRDPSRDNQKGPEQVHWRSVEHNLDYYCLALRLSRFQGRRQELWRERAIHARKFVLSMWEGEFFWAGTTADGPIINDKSPAPADAQTWAILAMGHDAEFRRTIGWLNTEEVPRCLRWVEKHCRAKQDRLVGYRFSNGGDNCWPEGACHLAAAYRAIGNDPEAQRVLHELVAAVPLVDVPRPRVTPLGGLDVPGGIVAAYPNDAFTGYLKDFGGPTPEPWDFKARPHIGATAWFIISANTVGKSNQLSNPYYLTGLPKDDL